MNACRHACIWVYMCVPKKPQSWTIRKCYDNVSLLRLLVFLLISSFSQTILYFPLCIMMLFHDEKWMQRTSDVPTALYHRKYISARDLCDIFVRKYFISHPYVCSANSSLCPSPWECQTHFPRKAEIKSHCIIKNIQEYARIKSIQFSLKVILN